MNAIEVENLKVSYSNLEVLKGVELSIPERICFAIMGPSGCGKSTLLKAMNRLLELNHGVRMARAFLRKTPSKSEERLEWSSSIQTPFRT